MPIILDGNGIIKNINFQHPSASATNLSLNSDGTIGGAIPYPNRNLIYNGACQIHQRSASVAGITSGGSGYYTADRWNATYTNLGTFTQTIENDAPTGSGFRKSLKMLCTTADVSPAAGDYMIIQQVLEGQDIQRIAKGTSSAQQLTLSFWVKSNTTGIFIAELGDLDNSRRVSASYLISASATWERKIITFPADTTGIFDNDNAASLEINFWLGSGSTFNGGSPLQTNWGTATSTRATNQTNLASSINNYWQITGVQLETGSIATPFEFKNYGQELRECQRYFNRLSATGTGVTYSGGGTTRYSLNFPVMRTIPVITQNSSCAVEDGTSAYGATWSSYNSTTATSSWISVTSTSFGASGKAIIVRDHILDINAEL